MKDAFLITGRSLDNYRARGVEIPPDVSREPCVGCGVIVTISPEGAAKLAEARAQHFQLAAAVCMFCAARVTGPGAEIHATKFGADLVEKRDEAKQFLAFLQEKARQP